MCVYNYLSDTRAQTVFSDRFSSAVLPGNILACCRLARDLSLAVIGPVIQTTVILLSVAVTVLVIGPLTISTSNILSAGIGLNIIVVNPTSCVLVV
jgi:hypothetical protein